MVDELHRGFGRVPFDDTVYYSVEYQYLWMTLGYRMDEGVNQSVQFAQCIHAWWLGSSSYQTIHL